MTLLALLACTPPEEAPVEFSDAARYGLEHFDDEATDALSAPLLALEEESYGTLDMASGSALDRALSLEILQEGDVAGIPHPDRDPGLAVPPVAVARESAYAVEEHVRVAMLADLSPMEPSSPNLYARTITDGEDCFADRGCEFMRSENRIRKERFPLEIEYDLNKDYRWVDLEDGRVAVAARSWMPETATEGSTTFWQSYTFEIFVPREDGAVLRIMALWSESETTPQLSEEDTLLVQAGGIDEIFKEHDAWIEDNP